MTFVKCRKCKFEWEEDYHQLSATCNNCLTIYELHSEEEQGDDSIYSFLGKIIEEGEGGN